jgi:hypothetical protein
MRGTAIAVAASLLLAGCAALSPPSCATGLKPMTRADLFFGRNIGNTPGVSDEDWRQFADEEITLRFPDGLTVEDASGQWKGVDGAVVHEASKHVVIVLSDAPGEASKLAAIREDYKRRFRQEAVLLLETESCGSF